MRVWPLNALTVPVGRGNVVEIGDLDVEMLDAGANGVQRQPVHRGDRDRMVSFVHPQEPDLELHAVDGLVDEIGEAGVEYGAVVAVHLMRLLRRHRHVAHPGVTGDEPAGRHVQRGVAGVRAGEDLLGQAVGSRKAHQAFNAAQRGLLACALGDRYAVRGHAREDFVEGAVVVELPAEGDDVLGRTVPQQEPAFVVVERKRSASCATSSRCMPMASRPKRRSPRSGWSR